MYCSTVYFAGSCTMFCTVQKSHGTAAGCVCAWSFDRKENCRNIDLKIVFFHLSILNQIFPAAIHSALKGQSLQIFYLDFGAKSILLYTDYANIY